MKKLFTLQQWLLAIRPQSLVASISPVLVGTAMATGDGIGHFGSAVLCFIGVICFHLITNLANDLGDVEHGVDTQKNLGVRAPFLLDMIRSGVISKAIILLSCCALFISYLLFLRGGWPIAVIAGLSLCAALFYTIGKKPLGYRGCGELIVLLFLGPVATAGSYYVQSLEINLAVILAGFGPGLISVGVLITNNLRDEINDRKFGKNTLVAQFGSTFGQWEYITCIITACLWPTLIYSVIQDHLSILICTLCIFIALPAIKIVLTKNDTGSLNKALEMTGKLILIYSVLFSSL